MIGLKTKIIIALLSLLVGAASSMYFTAEYKDAKYQAAINKQKAEAANQLQAATVRAMEAERSQAETTRQLEIKDVENQKALDRALADNYRLAVELGGLRDPGHRDGCGSTVPAAAAATGQADDGTAGALLSAEATGFLLEFAREADEAAKYAMTCHEWAKQISGAE